MVAVISDNAWPACYVVANIGWQFQREVALHNMFLKPPSPTYFNIHHVCQVG
jgi:hypothetical protein